LLVSRRHLDVSDKGRALFVVAMAAMTKPTDPKVYWETFASGSEVC
jgi:hypothetical protein